MRVSLGFCIVLIVLGRSPNALAGAWTLPRGEGQVIASLNYSASGAGVDDRGNQVSADSFQRIDISTYTEYGVRDWLTIGAQPRYQWAHSGGVYLKNRLTASVT